MTVPDHKGRAITALAADMFSATEVAIASFEQGFMCQIYGTQGATHLWNGTRWETRKESLENAARIKATQH